MKLLLKITLYAVCVNFAYSAAKRPGLNLDGPGPLADGPDLMLPGPMPGGPGPMPGGPGSMLGNQDPSLGLGDPLGGFGMGGPSMDEVLADPALSGLTTFEKCDGYIPFKGKFICPEKAARFKYDEVNEQLAAGRRAPYDGVGFLSDIDHCYNASAEEPLARFPQPKSSTRSIVFIPMCEMKGIPIYYVWSTKRAGRRDQCVVVNHRNFRQSLQYSVCVNPITPEHDMCQLDYSFKPIFRCVQSGFIRRSVIIYCPIDDSGVSFDGYYDKVDYLVPTTCSCRKCGNCEGDNRVLDFLDTLIPF